MSTLTSEKKHLFVDEIMKLHKRLNVFKPENTLQSLERFENQLTLNEMEACFRDSKPEELDANLVHLLSARWERIRNSNMCYTQQPRNLVNQLCFEIAKAISPPAATASEIEELAPNAGPYCLLMPSLENSEDIYGENIHSLGLHEFVLSDNERVFIPLAQCLHQASLSDEGQLRQMVAIDEELPELTSSEVARVSNHSKQAGDFYQSIIAFNKQRLLADDIGAKLSQLANGLRGGGAHRRGHGSGSEFNAGSQANLAIVAFGEYWEALSERQKSAIFTEEPKLKDVLGRLFRPNDMNYKDTRFCVELLAGELDPIIHRYNKKPDIETLRNRVLEKESAFKKAAQSRDGLVVIQNDKPPKHILHHIFKLNIGKQQVLFKQQVYKNALMYALAHEPEALAEFELNEASKKQALNERFNPHNSSALIIAAKRGKIDAVRLLLSWGADIESHDANKDTALHWAAYNGHIDTVRFLLENNASLEARGYQNNTALNFSVRHGKGPVVELLLKRSANVNARNSEGKNALDIAIASHPEFIELILMQLATLPADEQSDCLLSVPGGPYPNVLFYAAAKKPALFDALLTTVLQQPSETSSRAVCDASNAKGWTPLILAAQIGAHESIPKLLASGLDIESHDLNNSTALHWSAKNGHVDAVNFLLENRALLEARGAGNNTTLNFAVMHGKGPVVELLLKKSANVNARNSRGNNALDIAIASHPELVKPILMQLATLPADEQADCLLNVPGGPYPNVLLYAAIEKPSLLNSLLVFSPSINSKDNLHDITRLLTEMHWDEHLQSISALYQRMGKKSHSNSTYIAAASAAETLLRTCAQAKITLFQSDDAIDKKILVFKSTCKSAIETAKPVLEKHREWGKVLAAFLLAIITLPISLPLYAMGLFSVKTKSAQLLDKLQEAIDKPGPRNS